MERCLADIGGFVRARALLAVGRIRRAAARRPFAAGYLGGAEVLVRHVGWNDIDRYAVFRVGVVTRVASGRNEDFQHRYVFVREHGKMIGRLQNRHAHFFVLRHRGHGDGACESKKRYCEQGSHGFLQGL